MKSFLVMLLGVIVLCFTSGFTVANLIMQVPSISIDDLIGPSGAIVLLAIAVYWFAKREIRIMKQIDQINRERLQEKDNMINELREEIKDLRKDQQKK